MANAYYTDLSVKVQGLIEKAEVELKIAVAWFTNRFLFKVVENAVKNGVAVKVIISDSPHNFGKLNFSKLETLGAEVYVCQSDVGAFMHNKFCIIDNLLAFSGSYNWSLNSDKCYENIIVADGQSVILPLTIFFDRILESSVRFSDYTPIPPQQGVNSTESVEDNYYYQLQVEFEQRVQESINETVRLGVPINTDNLYRLIDKYTAIGAAKFLTSSQQGKNLQSGFVSLARAGRLDLTFEYLVANPHFAPLFKPQIIQYAQQKLQAGSIEAQLPRI